MDAVLAVVSLVATVTLAGMSIWLLAKMLRTIVELRRITLGMHAALGWALGRVSDPPGKGAVVDATSSGGGRIEGR